MPARIFYDTANGHRLRFVEHRDNGKALYDDLDNGERVVCAPEAVDLYPRQIFPFAPFMPALQGFKRFYPEFMQAAHGKEDF